MPDTTVATAETTAIYRGVELDITVKKYSYGVRTVAVTPKRVSTALRPDLAGRDANDTVSTSKTSFEAATAQLALDEDEWSSIKTVVKRRRTVFDALFRRGSPSVSSVVATSLEQAKEAIDAYIEKRQAFSIEAGEVRHGIDRAVVEQGEPVTTDNSDVQRSEEVGNASLGVHTVGEQLAADVEEEMN